MKRVLAFILISLFLISFVIALPLTSRAIDNSSENSQEECTKEGKNHAVVPGQNCCEGLENIGCDGMGTDGKCEYGCVGGSYCTKCGNGECKSPETKCNCPEDCEGAICGNDLCEERETSTEKWLTCSSEDNTYCKYKVCDEDCGTQQNASTRIKNAIQKKNRIKNQYQNQSECPSNCTCTGSVTKCQLANGGREMTVTAGKSGNIIIQVKGINASTNVTLYKSDGRLYGVFKNNETKRVRILPDQVQEKIREKFAREFENETVSLDEDKIYRYRAEKKARLFAIFPVKEKVEAEIDPETGKTIKVRTSWWGFLARDEKVHNIVGGSCITANPNNVNECCQNKGYNLWNSQTSECEFSEE